MTLFLYMYLSKRLCECAIGTLNWWYQHVYVHVPTSVNDYIVLFHKYLLCTYYVLSFVLSTEDTTLNRESLCFGSLFHSSRGERRQISTKKKIKLGQGWSLGGNGEAI